MSYSMLSTKRKFHRLLDSFTPSGPALPNNIEHPELSASNGAHATDSTPRPAKRVRSAVKQRSEFVKSSPYLTTLLNEHAARNKISSIASTPSARLRRDEMVSSYSSPQEGSEVIRLPVPTWNTSDKRAFQARLATFNVIENWFNKPPDIHAMVFAKWGWTLVGRETVKCVTCHSQWVAYAGDSPFRDEDQPEDEDEAEDEEVDYTKPMQLHGVKNPIYVERTKARIETEHDTGCPWRQFQHCPDSILSVSMWPPNSCAHSLYDRFTGVLKYSAILPRALRVPYELENGEDNLERVWRAFSEPATDIYGSSGGEPPAISIENPLLPAEKPADVRQRALAIALLGWGLDPQPARRPENEACLKCSQCYARVGLWYFTGLDGHKPMYQWFDLVDKHEGWCPWINAETQHADLTSSESEPKAAWEIVRSVVISLGSREILQAKQPATTVLSNSQGLASTGALESTPSNRTNLEGSVDSVTSGQTRAPAPPLGPEQASREPPPVEIPTDAPKLTDEERRKKHKLGLSWLSKIKGSMKSSKREDKVLDLAVGRASGSPARLGPR